MHTGLSIAESGRLRCITKVVHLIGLARVRKADLSTTVVILQWSFRA